MSWLKCDLQAAGCQDPAYGWQCTNSTNASTCEYTSWHCNSDNSCRTQANPDISGQGVLVSFFVTAILTFVCAWAMLLLDATYTGDDHKSLSVLDRRFIWAIGFWKKKKNGVVSSQPNTKLAQWKLVLQKVLLALSDGHLLTGLAILIAGFSQACSITIYHYHAVVYLAWTSSSVHLVTLTISRFYLRNNKPVLIARLFFITVLFVLLFLALCLTASTTWPTSIDAKYTFDQSAICTWTDGNLDKWRGDTVFALIILSLGYVFRLCKVFATTSDFCRRWLRTTPEDALKRAFLRMHLDTDKSRGAFRRIFCATASWFILATYMYLQAFYDIFESLLIELIWMTLSLLWGFAQIFSWHRLSPLNQFEMQWNFGQILPMLLVVAPLLALPAYYSESHEDIKRRISLHQISSDESLEMQPLVLPDHTHKLVSKPFDAPRSFWTETAIEPRNDLVTGVSFLDQPNGAYKSINYNILVFFVFAAALVIFGIIVYPKFLTDKWYVKYGDNTFDTWTRFFNNRWMWIEVWIPTLCGPGVLWFLIMAPTSRVIRRALRRKSKTLLGSSSP